jgi:lactate racemase
VSQSYFLYRGKREREPFTLPSRWKVAYFIEEGMAKGEVPSLGKMVTQAIAGPLDSPGLASLAARARNIVVVVDDHNRPTPAAGMLPHLLALLEESGAPRESITILVALGTHAPLNEKQLELKVGKEVVRSYRLAQHDAWAADLVPLATLKSGRRVRINPIAASADLKITLGSVLPHPMAGFGGTPKMIMPGLADFDTIREHHIAYVAHPHSRLGRLADNPFQQECMSVTRQVGVDFCINCLYDQLNRVVEVVAGSLDASFSTAVERSLARLGFAFGQKVDVAITSTVPHVHGPQMLKAMSAPGTVTREKGAIVLFAPLEEPLPDSFVSAFEEIQVKSNKNPLPYVLETLARGEPLLPGRPMDFNMAVFDTFSRAENARVILVCPYATREKAAVFGFEYASSLDEALSKLEVSYPEAQVAIFPAGGLVIPRSEG